MLSVVEFADVLAEAGAADTRVALHVHVVPQRQNHLRSEMGRLTQTVDRYRPRKISRHTEMRRYANKARMKTNKTKQKKHEKHSQTHKLFFLPVTKECLQAGFESAESHTKSSIYGLKELKKKKLKKNETRKKQMKHNVQIKALCFMNLSYNTSF